MDVFLEQEKRSEEIHRREWDRALRWLKRSCKQCGGSKMVPHTKVGQVPCPSCRRRREWGFKRGRRRVGGLNKTRR